MKIPEPIREKFSNTAVKDNPKIKENNNGKDITEGNERKKSTEITGASTKKRKIRMCIKKSLCTFKNVWTYTDRCYAPFSVWNTCMSKGDERKI